MRDMTKVGRFIFAGVALTFMAAATGAIIIFAQLASLQSSLVGREQSIRLNAAAPQPLPANHPALALIQQQIAAHARPESFADWRDWRVSGECDGDGKPDWIDGELEVHLTATHQTLRLAHGFSELKAIGLDDVDGDGAMDAWWADPGDHLFHVGWGDAQHHIPSSQSFVLTNYDVAGAAFFDVDGDGRKDYVYLEEKQADSLPTPPQRRIFWIKLSPAR